MQPLYSIAFLLVILRWNKCCLVNELNTRGPKVNYAYGLLRTRAALSRTISMAPKLIIIQTEAKPLGSMFAGLKVDLLELKLEVN